MELALAARAKVRGSLALHDLFDGRSANMARQSRAIIDEIIELEIARLAIAAHEIAQRAAALFDRRGQCCAHGVGEEIVAHERDATSGDGRPDTRAKQALGRINVAYAYDHRAREQRLLDGHLASARLPVHQRTGKFRREWLYAQACQQWMVEDIAVG